MPSFHAHPRTPLTFCSSPLLRQFRRTNLHTSTSPSHLPRARRSRVSMSVDTRWSGITRVILGSKSWSRHQLLKTLNPPALEIVPADIDEAAIRHPDATQLVLTLARAKAVSLLKRPELASVKGLTLLITGDSVVTHAGRILEKPASEDEARAFLRSYAHGPATTVSSIMIVDVVRRLYWIDVDSADVHFRRMPNVVIDELIHEGGAMESAGGLRVESPLVQPYIDSIVGERSALMGFSLPLVERLIDCAVSSVNGSPLD